MKATITWLHLTDLHLGMKEQIRLLPNIQSRFLSDLKIVHDKAGPIDLVLFTGDIVQQGDHSEFDKADEFLNRLRDELQRLGSKNCELLVVPGNHDLVRPRMRSAVRFLTEWNGKDLPQEFWSDPASSYREIVNEAFRNYEDWWARFRPRSINPGSLPGDFSYTFKKGDLRLGIVGLNSAFLQLTGGDYLGKLALSATQFNDACGGAGMDWARKHHFNFLLTHHPPAWLNPESRQEFMSDIADPDAFIAHFCGHVHDALYKAEAKGGAPLRRCYQAKSIFGFEEYEGSKPGEISRLHGYTVGRLEVSDENARLIFWPREAQYVDRWNFVPDTKSYALQEDRTKAELLEVPTADTRELEADEAARIERSLRLTLTIKGDGVVRCREVSTIRGQIQVDETIRAVIDYFTARLLNHQSNPYELKILGRLLFRALFNGDVRVAFEQRLRRAEQSGPRPRFRLEFTNADDLALLPWEYMHYSRKDGSFFLSTITDLTLSRFMPPDQKVTEGEENLNILVVVGKGEDGRLHFDTESILKAVPQQSIRCDATKMALNEALKNEEKAIHMVHFIGANKMEGAEHKIAVAGASGWVEEDEFVKLVTGKAVLPVIKVADAKVPRLVLLQLCGDSSLDASMAGLAKKIINAGVPFVVASQHRIKDKAKDSLADDPAALFARGFYAALMQKQPVDLAVQAGRNEILTSTDPLAFGTPVLYLCCDAKPLLVAKQSSGRTPGTIPSGADQQTTATGTRAEPAPIVDRRESSTPILQEPQQAVAAAAAGSGATIVSSRGSVGGWKLIAAIKKAGLDKGKELNREADTKQTITTMMNSVSDVESIRKYLEDKINNEFDLLDVYAAMREVLDKGE